MTWHIFKFDLKFHFRSPLFYILFVLFFLFSFGAVTSDAVSVGGGLGNINRNAPFVIMQLSLVLSLIFGVLSAAAYVANAIHRDFELNTDSLFFSAPIKKSQYLTGRFLAAFTMISLVFSGVIFGIMLGAYMPWVDKAHVGPFIWQHYAFSYFALIVPNLLLSCAIFFAVSALTRSQLWTYVSVAAFYVGYATSRILIGLNVDNRTVKSLTDPFGISPFALNTRYWTVFEKNAHVLDLAGPFLYNRLLWLGIAFGLLALTYAKFRMQVANAGGGRSKKSFDDGESQRIPLAMPVVTQKFDFATAWQQFRSTVSIERRAIMSSLPFLVILMLAVLNVAGGAYGVSNVFGTTVYPVTHLMAQAINGGFVFFVLIIATFYAGEIVFRERSVKLNEVCDTAPAPTWTMWAGKLTALILVCYVTLVIAVATTVIVQLIKGYTHIEPGVYLKEVFFISGIDILLFTVLAFFAQIATNNKYLGYLFSVIYIIATAALGPMHFEHRLYRVFDLPVINYSDMNGFGHYLAQHIWFMVYWTLFAGVLLLIGNLFWVRGTESAFAIRRRIARQRFGRHTFAAMIVLFIGFAASGCYIYYNTNVLNEYSTADQREKIQSETEKLYKKYERLPQPRITDAQANVDIYPEKRWIDAHGTYTMVNKTATPIRDVYVAMNPEVSAFSATIPGASIVTNDRKHGYTLYRFAEPMQPGARLDLTWDVKIHNQGFQNDFRDNTVVNNGTFVNSQALCPHLGYTNTAELGDPAKRSKYGLPKVVRMANIDDQAAAMNSELSREADWINLDTTVSTSRDQIAIAPGYLQKEWQDNGRLYFHYKTTSPILPFWSYLSARYTVKRGEWIDPSGMPIPIEIYYDAKHPFNVDRMIYSVQKSLDYFSRNFSPYQHKQVRIIEFPNYSSFAQSFPNTIPWSESLGFIADLRDKDDIDYVFYVGAHEVGHQWWAHQVCGADVQGATMITETLAQYSALMVMEKEYGPAKMRKFLKFELDRYLNGRGGELVAEMPLMLVENQQYIHYRKGSLVMYALRDAIGEDHVNAALRQFIKDHAFGGPPYPTTKELVADFRAQTPPEMQSMITDLFETITLYDNKASEAKVEQRGGKYVVTVTVESKKFRSDDRGHETYIPIHDYIDVGVLGESKAKAANDNVLAIEKKLITSPKMTFQFVVDKKPQRAGIDPLNKLIDRNPDDNVKTVD